MSWSAPSRDRGRAGASYKHHGLGSRVWLQLPGQKWYLPGENRKTRCPWTIPPQNLFPLLSDHFKLFLPTQGPNSLILLTLHSRLQRNRTSKTTTFKRITMTGLKLLAVAMLATAPAILANTLDINRWVVSDPPAAELLKETRDVHELPQCNGQYYDPLEVSHSSAQNRSWGMC